MTLEEKMKYFDKDKNTAAGISSEGLSAGSHRRVWLRCEAGHSRMGEFRAADKCPYCAGNRVLAGYNDLETLFPRIAAEWHPTKNGDLRPSEVASKSSARAFWLCPDCGYEYDAFISNRTRRGDGCPACSMKRLVVGLNDFATLHPELVCEWGEDNALSPSELRGRDTKRFIKWRCSDGRCYHETVFGHLERHARMAQGIVGARRKRVAEFLSEHRDFLTENWSRELNGRDFSALTSIGGKWRWRCSKCSVIISRTVTRAERGGLLCDGCVAAARDRALAAEKAKKEHSKILRRSFGQTAIAFYLGRIEGVSVSEEVSLDPSRRFRVDVVAMDSVTGRSVAIEHDSELYHSGEQRVRSDREKDELMRSRYDKVLRIVAGKSGEGAMGDYFYRECSRVELENAIARLIEEHFGRGADVDLKRDTMQILRMKEYRNAGRARWNGHILERLGEDFRPEDNAGFRLEDFSPRVYYHALWRCKKCNGSFYAAISNRVRGDGCPYCISRREKAAVHESFAAVYPEKAKNWAEENELLPTEVTPKSGYNAKWRCCVCGHEWQTPVSVVAGSKYGGCNACAIKPRNLKKYKPVERLDPESGECLQTYGAIFLAREDGFPKVERAIKSGRVYKGFIFRLAAPSSPTH